MPCLFGNKAERSHARLGVDLKEIQAFHALAVVPAKIGARAALAAQRLVRGQGHVHRRLRNIRRNLRRADMGGEAIGIFRVVRSEEHTSELQSLMRISYAGFCLKNKK